MAADFLSMELTRPQFEKISGWVYSSTGIKLGEGKEGLVKSRLLKRLRLLNLEDFNCYVEFVENDSTGREITAMIDVLTTNKTSFFRESQHFEFLRDCILQDLLASHRRIRIWSAGCSSGEEPYSIAILLREAVPEIDRRDIRILATDINTSILARAREGVYEQDAVHDIPSLLLQKYFTLTSCKPTRLYSINNCVRDLVRLAQLNLMDEWPMRGPFEVIFCRNVMIYFDKPTQRCLVQRFWKILELGGHLFVGHSESLTGSCPGFRYVKPATYVKESN
jgi:chemotaxis protein methyltransferase CheR